jgi:hypothetical protein
MKSFGNNAAAIKTYVTNALQVDGDAFCGPDSTSQACINVVRASRITLIVLQRKPFFSEFIIPLFATHIKICKKAVLDYGYPGGALALATVAVCVIHHVGCKQHLF